ncbi:hypothetical protein DRN50_06515 [Thermococci archaeon]|nr:MAG: hypothetical protein DRN50_06515 [Thermococci archaeon]
MGFSTIGATLIIGISIIAMLSIFSTEILPVVFDINDSYRDLENRILEKSQTSINITNVTLSNVGGNLLLNVTVKNTGSVSLNTSDFSILVNGTKKSFTATKSVIHPEKEAIFTITVSSSGSKRIKVITYNGVADYAEYGG